MADVSLQVQSKRDDKSHSLAVLVKGKERYIFLYDSASLHEVLWTLDRYAADPDLSFTLSDRAVVAQHLLKPTLTLRSAS